MRFALDLIAQNGRAVRLRTNMWPLQHLQDIAYYHGERDQELLFTRTSETLTRICCCCNKRIRLGGSGVAGTV